MICSIYSSYIEYDNVEQTIRLLLTMGVSFIRIGLTATQTIDTIHRLVDADYPAGYQYRGSNPRINYYPVDDNAVRAAIEEDRSLGNAPSHLFSCFYTGRELSYPDGVLSLAQALGGTTPLYDRCCSVMLLKRNERLSDLLIANGDGYAFTLARLLDIPTIPISRSVEQQRKLIEQAINRRPHSG